MTLDSAAHKKDREREMDKLSSSNPWRERTSGGFSGVKQLTNPRAGLLAPAESVAMVTSDQDA